MSTFGDTVTRLSRKLSCNWLVMIVTMATLIASDVNDKNSIFTAREDKTF